MLKEYKDDRVHYFLDEHGLIQGEYKSRNDKGMLFLHCFWLNNEYHGEYKTWHENGQLRVHCFFFKNSRHGEYKWRDVNGKIVEHCFYIDGREVSFNEVPYPKTEEDRMYFTLKHNIPLIG